MKVTRSRFFSPYELTCRCGCGDGMMDEAFMHSLDRLREEYGSPLKVSSAYRCPVHNRKVSSTGGSGPHTTRRAIDFAIRGDQAHRLLRLALEMGCFTGVGINQKGGARFLHFDNLLDGSKCPRPWVWTY